MSQPMFSALSGGFSCIPFALMLCTCLILLWSNTPIRSSLEEKGFLFTYNTRFHPIVMGKSRQVLQTASHSIEREWMHTCSACSRILSSISPLLSSPDPCSGDSVLFSSISRVLNFTRDFFFDVFISSLLFNIHVLMDFLVFFLLFLFILVWWKTVFKKMISISLNGISSVLENFPCALEKMSVGLLVGMALYVSLLGSIA